jgi:aryl-alcohol dehydrogenase-like predicted oxidoreductase
MDYLDVYMLHWPINKLAVEHFTSDASVIAAPPTIEEAYEQLDALKKEGLIRSIGMSNFGRTQMEEVVRTGVQIDVNEMSYNIVSRAIEGEIAPYCLKNDISIIGSMGLQQGLLAGIYKTVEDVPPHQAHSRHFSQERGKGTSRHNEAGAEKEIFEVVDQLRLIAKDLRLHIAQLAIAWILKKPFMASTLVGSRNIDELKMNIDACSLEISDETEALIDKISQPALDKLGFNPDYYEHSSKSRIF